MASRRDRMFLPRPYRFGRIPLPRLTPFASRLQNGHWYERGHVHGEASFEFLVGARQNWAPRSYPNPLASPLLQIRPNPLASTLHIPPLRRGPRRIWEYFLRARQRVRQGIIRIPRRGEAKSDSPILPESSCLAPTDSAESPCLASKMAIGMSEATCMARHH